MPPAARSRYDRATGVEVIEVVDDSPAARAGLRAEDLVVAIDGEPVLGVSDVQWLMNAERIGTELAITVLRACREVELSAFPVELE